MNLSMNKKVKEILEELELDGKLKVWWDFHFPEPKPLKLRLKDMLEPKVDEKYYLSDKVLDNIQVTDRASKNQESCIQVGTLTGDKWDKMIDSSRRVYSDEGISPTVHTCGGGNTELKVQTLEEIKQPTIEEIVAKLEGGNKDE